MPNTNRVNTKVILKAASFTAAMLLAENYLFSSSEEHHHHHHHHHHHDQDDVAAFIGNLLSITATVLISSGRFVVASASLNNSAILGMGEFALNYFSPGGSVIKSAFRGIFAAGTSAAINSIAPNETAQPASTKKLK